MTIFQVIGVMVLSIVIGVNVEGSCQKSGLPFAAARAWGYTAGIAFGLLLAAIVFL